MRLKIPSPYDAQAATVDCCPGWGRRGLLREPVQTRGHGQSSTNRSSDTSGLFAVDRRESMLRLPIRCLSYRYLIMAGCEDTEHLTHGPVQLLWRWA